jgi:hypothetical protein
MANLQQYEAGVTALEKELAQCKATLQVRTCSCIYSVYLLY